MDRSPRLLIAFLLALAAATGIAALRLSVASGFDADEIEHAHVSWSLGQGIAPYRDLHQIHTPLLWILSEPVVGALPENRTALLALRAGCLASFVGACLVGLVILREVTGRVRVVPALAMSVLALAVVGDYQFYRFRPDPFMALCTTLAILAATRLNRGPARYATLAGVALGLAASFSPKMFPLCLLVPVICLFEAMRRRSPGPLWLVAPNFLGFLVGIGPMLGWVAANGLLAPFWTWTMENNAGALGLCVYNTALFVAHEDSKVFMALAVLGAFAVIRSDDRPRPAAWPPAVALVVGVVLAWLVLLVQPHHLIYNLQPFAVPAAVLAGVAVGKLSAWDEKWAPATVVAALALLLVVTRPVVQGLTLHTRGVTIRQQDWEGLADLCRSDDARCIGFAPYHPVFCRDASELYLGWDLWFLEVDWLCEAGKQSYRATWRQSIDAVEQRRPTLIVRPDMWRDAHRLGAIGDEDYRRFLHAAQTHYEARDVGDVRVLVRKASNGPAPEAD
jgi:hypothetical protein